MATSPIYQSSPAASPSVGSVSSISSSSSIAASPYWAHRIFNNNNHNGDDDSSNDGEDDDGVGFSPIVAFCFTINCIIGTGFLTIPWAFVQSGLALSTIVLTIMCIFSDIAKDFLLETMARAESMLDNNMHWIKKKKPPKKIQKLSGDVEQNNNEHKPLLVYSPIIYGGLHPLTSYHNDAKNNKNNNTQDDTTTIATTPTITTPLSVSGNNSNSAIHDDNITTNKNMNTYGNNFPPPSSPIGTPRRERLLLLHKNAAKNNDNPTTDKEGSEYIIKDRKFEINILCRIFLGKFGLNIHTAFVIMYFYGTLWAYTSVFASSKSKLAPIFVSTTTDSMDSATFGAAISSIVFSNYTCYAVLFAIIVIPLSCLELKEQITIQIFLTCCRFVMLFFMVFTCNLCSAITAAGEKNSYRNENMQMNDTTTILLQDDNGGVPMFRPSKLYKTLPILVFATLYHQSIPILSNDVRNKKKLSNIFRSTTIFCVIMYSVIGYVLGSAFGEKYIEESVNLNWEILYHDTEDVSLVIRMISFYIICFPAIDVISAFPLNSICLGNNMMSAYYGKDIHIMEKNRSKVTQFRLLACLPPIVLGILIKDLSTITDYAGTTGFIITFSIPSILYLKSKQIASKKHYSATTYYSQYSISNKTTEYFFGSTTNNSNGNKKKTDKTGIIPYVLFYFGIVMVIFSIIFSL